MPSRFWKRKRIVQACTVINGIRKTWPGYRRIHSSAETGCLVRVLRIASITATATKFKVEECVIMASLTFHMPDRTIGEFDSMMGAYLECGDTELKNTLLRFCKTPLERGTVIKALP